MCVNLSRIFKTVDKWIIDISKRQVGSENNEKERMHAAKSVEKANKLTFNLISGIKKHTRMKNIFFVNIFFFLLLREKKNILRLLTNSSDYSYYNFCFFFFNLFTSDTCAQSERTNERTNERASECSNRYRLQIVFRAIQVDSIW